MKTEEEIKNMIDEIQKSIFFNDATGRIENEVIKALEWVLED